MIDWNFVCHAVEIGLLGVVVIILLVEVKNGKF